MKTLSIDEFHAAIDAQGAPSKEKITFICPMCKTHQNADSLIAAGAGSNFDEVERYLGFSCVGRWLGAPSPRKTPDGKPCNWTLGGLFTLHELEIVTTDGKSHPLFELANEALK